MPVKRAAIKVSVSIFDVNNRGPEAADITVSLDGDDGLFSFKLFLSADGYAGNDLAMNAVASAQGWHRRLGRLNKRNIGPMNTKNNGAAFNGFLQPVTSVRMANVSS